MAFAEAWEEPQADDLESLLCDFCYRSTGVLSATLAYQFAARAAHWEWRSCSRQAAHLDRPERFVGDAHRRCAEEDLAVAGATTGQSNAPTTCARADSTTRRRTVSPAQRLH